MYNHLNINRSTIYPRLATLIAVLIGVIVIYLPILDNGFVWDDWYSFFEDPTYRDPENLVKALTGALIYQENFFRPLPVLSFLIQIHVFELSATKMHLVSLVIHLVNTLLVMLVSMRLLMRFDKSFSYWSVALAGLIYGLHPALVEPVSYISTRFDMLMTTFLLLALYVDQRVLSQWLRASTVGVLFLLAALCKEMAVGFALALPLLHYYQALGKKDSLRNYLLQIKLRGDLHVYIAIIISGLVYLLLRYNALGLLFDNASYSNNIELTLLERLALIGLSVYKYLILLLFPVGNISPAHQLSLPLTFTDYRVLLGFTYLLGLIALIWRYKKNGISILVANCVVLASLSPVLGFILLPRSTGWYFSESFLPFPVALLVLVIAPLLNRIVKAEIRVSKNILTAARAGLIIWVSLMAFTVSSTIPIWKNAISLWSWARIFDPENIQVSNNLGAAFLKAKQYKSAVDESTIAVGIKQSSDLAWNNLALGLNGLGRYDEAVFAAEQAMNLDPSAVRNNVTLGKIYISSNKLDKGESILRNLLKSQPHNLSANILLAYLCKDLRRFHLAERHMNTAIKSLPEGKERQLLIGWIQELPKQTSSSSTEAHVERKSGQRCAS